MKHSLLSLCCLLILSACAVPPSSTHREGHAVKGEHASSLTLQDQSNDSEIAFTILEETSAFKNFGISHTKEMHLIVVRDDLQYFSHLHPTRDESGTWRVSYKTPAGGKYWLYADFVEQNQSAHTILFERSYDGKTGTVGIAKNAETIKTLGGYRIELQTAKDGENVSFTYKITNTNGQPVQVEEYLGARGHSVLISMTGDFIHAHASEEGAHPVFTTTLPPGKFYRAFTQFQIDGKVVTVNFDWLP
ncbi:hypothetical protein EXS65_03330 [Candidatus Peribacteria bacterium]|nr:hypothetical protein [Candidatus Peribacteria bacterium]